MSEPDVSDLAEVDDFFRRGEQISAMAHSLEPPMGLDIEDANVDDGFIHHVSRTPEQRARRQRFIRYVSVSMGGLVLGLVLVFAKQTLVGKSWSTNGLRVAVASAIEIPRLQPKSVDGAVQPPDAIQPSSSHCSVQPTELPTQSKVTLVVDTVVPVDEPKAVVVRRTLADIESASLPAPIRVPPTKSVAFAVKAQASSAPEVSQTVGAPKAVSRLRRAVTASVTQTQSPVVTSRVKPADYKPPTASFAD
jgi:hypothetical protein